MSNDSTMTLMDTPKYFMELYHKSLKEIKEADLDSRLNFPKWKRDILLSLLEKARPLVKHACMHADTTQKEFGKAL
jgi:hypothetical protein